MTVLLDDLEASPTPYHAVAQASLLLEEAGFCEIPLRKTLPNDAGKYFLSTGGALVAWVQGAAAPSEDPRGYTIVGTHTDSPNLRMRTNADVSSAGWRQVGIETYGGLLLNSWLDRDLGIAGRVSVLVDGQPAEILIRDDQPVLRVPQLAIHLDRDIREKGLKLNPQTQMTPLWATEGDDESTFADYVAALAGVDSDSILSWDLMAFDTQPPRIVGRDSDMFASARIDNLLSTFCAVRALSCAADGDTWPADRSIPVLALYDHEEVGSESSTGAAGSFLADILERIGAANGRNRTQHLEDLVGSFVISADGAHATHPNYADKHEPNHHVALNAGVVVKRNANQRYASSAQSEARFRAACARSNIPVQTYIHRNDLPCGSTIGPATSAELGVSTIDIGAPQLAMHSIREMAGVRDADHLADALAALWSE